jgi:hypothetical protein
MKLPYKPSLMTVRRTRPRFIIIHHTAELYLNPSIKIDNNTYQYGKLSNGALELKDADIQYHFVVEKIGDDYQTIMARPFVYICDGFEDIPEHINNASIHVALLGNYNFRVPSSRMYETLGYRCLAPLLKILWLNPDRIKLHKDVSEDENCQCPGEFVDLAIIKSMARRFLKR